MTPTMTPNICFPAPSPRLPLRPGRRRGLALATILLAAAFGFVPPARSQDSPTPDDIEWPADPQTVVIEFDFVGGFRAPQIGEPAGPRLRILADGTARSASNGPGLANVEFPLGTEAAQKLYRYLLEQGLAKLDSDQIRREIEATERPIRIADAPASRFSIYRNGQLHVVEVYALAFVVRQYPEIPALGRLLEAQEKLMAIAYRAHLGTDAEANQILAQVNAALKDEVPDFAPFRLDELRSATTRDTGARSANWSRTVTETETPMVVTATYADEGTTDSANVQIRTRPLANR